MSTNSFDFKLLAIRPLEKCDSKYSNNLIPGTFYKFYQYYNFQQENGFVTQITKTGSDFNIYDDYIPEGCNLKINVSAIVGKNGSGKSSLVELFYLCAYLVASTNDLLPTNDKSPSGIKQNKELEKIREGLKLEVYYQIADQYRCVVIDTDYSKQKYPKSNIQFYDLLGGEKVPLAEFFYTIAINYSIYGLNESTMGIWINRLFHKNDGYQTPIVINPFRERGTININGEMHFAQTRLLSNIRFDKNEVDEMVSGKGIREIQFLINKEKLSRPTGHPNERIFDELETQIGKSKKEIFELIYTAMLGESTKPGSMSRRDWEEMTIDYVITKAIRIAKNYPEYRDYYSENTEEQVPTLKELDTYLEELKKDLTHVTLKLRQALNFFRNDPLRLDDERISYSMERITIPAKLFAERFQENKKNHPDRDPMEFIPIAPFSPRIILDDGSKFHEMSSGQQQFVHSIQSVLYHILNVDSVFKQKKSPQKETYNSINIIFDEIELYFHPEYQRIFVSEILKRISNLNTPNITSINIIFLTHSPFILSDIPVVNVLHLEEGHTISRQQPTFAANIHQMLSSSFFMKSTTGEFSKFQYDEIIKFYQKVRDYTIDNIESTISEPQTSNLQNPPTLKLMNLREEYWRRYKKFNFVINQIGEPVISGVLKNHLAFIKNKLSIEDTSSMESPSNLFALRKHLERQLEDVNQKIRRSDDQD